MSHKYSADLGWLKVTGEEDDATKFSALLERLSGLRIGPTPTGEEMAFASASLLLDQEWVMDSIFENFQEKHEAFVRDQVMLLFNERANKEMPKSLEPVGESPVLLPCLQEGQESELSDIADLRDFSYLPPMEPPTEEQLRELEGESDESALAETHEAAEEAPAEDVSSENVICHITKIEEPSTETAKEEFRRIKQECGFLPSELVAAGNLPNSQWIHNRASGAASVRPEDLEALKRAVAKAERRAERKREAEASATVAIPPSTAPKNCLTVDSICQIVQARAEGSSQEDIAKALGVEPELVGKVCGLLSQEVLDVQNARTPMDKTSILLQMRGRLGNSEKDGFVRFGCAQ